MNLRAVLLFFGTLITIPLTASAQKLDKVTRLEVEYWRAFHGVIKIDVFVTSEESREMSLNATVTPGGKGDQREQHFVKPVSEKDVRPFLEFFNSGEVRQYFADNGPVLQPDGSGLSITLTQNSYSLCFTSQYAFRRSPKHAAELGRIALEVFKLAGMKIPEKELY